MSAQSSLHDTRTGRLERSFVRTAKARGALARGSLACINLDVQLAATMALKTASRVRRLRGEIAKQIPAFDLDAIDELGTYAEALLYAQTMYVAATDPTRAAALSSLLVRGGEVRARLLSDASVLAHRNLIDPAALSRLKGGKGYLNVAADLGALVRLLRERWEDIEDRTAIQPGDLDEAAQLGDELAEAFVQRDRPPPQLARAAEDRHRAYTLLVNAYDEVRRAVSFLRWHEGDVEKFAPSLWTGRGGRDRSRAADGQS